MKTTFTREGMLFLLMVVLLFIGTAMRQVNLLLLLASLLCCSLIIAWRLGRNSIAFMEVNRFVPKQIHAGETFLVTLDLLNPLKRHGSLAVVVEDTLRFCNGKGRLSKPMRPAVYFEHVPPEKHAKKNYAGVLPRRGRYFLGPVTISTRFPFGLFRTCRDISPAGASTASAPGSAAKSGKESIPIIVFPRLGKLGARWKARQHEATESRHRRRFRPSRVGGEFLTLRNWRQGDLRRWIHWRASARHRTLVVRQFEQHQNHDATILLDLYHPGPMNIARQENVELAVSLAATLISEMSRQAAASLTLGFYGARLDTDPAASLKSSENDPSVAESCEILTGPTCTPLIDSMLVALALLEPKETDRLAELLSKTLSRIDMRGDIFLITTAPLDLMSTDRLENLKSDPRFRPLASRIRIMDTSDPRLEEIFTLG